MPGADDPSRTTDDVPCMRWASVPEMDVGCWVEIPIDDEGPPRWLRVVATMPPSWTGEHRWALLVGCGPDEWWIKAAPWLVFRTSGYDPGCR